MMTNECEQNDYLSGLDDYSDDSLENFGWVKTTNHISLSTDSEHESIVSSEGCSELNSYLYARNISSKLTCKENEFTEESGAIRVKEEISLEDSCDVPLSYNIENCSGIENSKVFLNSQDRSISATPSVSEMLIKKEKRKMNEDFSDTDDESLTDNEKCTGNLQSDSNKSESKEKIKTEIPSLLESETYRPVEVDFEVDLNNLTEDEELWMVQCPVSLNPKTLKNKVFFVESSEFIFKVEDQKYSVTTNIHKIPPITCVTPSEEADCFRANILKPVGLMVIKEDLEVPEIAFTSTTKQRKRPNSSRVRHPLFGGDYEDELDIRRRLTSYSYAVDREIVIPSKKKKKKKKKDKKNVLEEEQKNNGIELKCISPGHSQSNALSEQGVDSAEKPKKKKKKMN